MLNKLKKEVNYPMKPLLLINFKTYSESAGENSLKLARSLDKIKSKHFQLAVAPSVLTTKEVVDNTKLMVFAQHADSVEWGEHTGSVSIAELQQIGVQGVILNHSECRLPFLYLQKTVDLCHHYWLKTIICASTMAEAKKILELKPDYLAFEPSELIGGEKSVSQAQPQSIIDLVKYVHKHSPGTKLLCGAGIHSSADVYAALGLGAQGVLLAHAVAQSADPKKFVEGLIK